MSKSQDPAQGLGQEIKTIFVNIYHIIHFSQSYYWGEKFSIFLPLNPCLDRSVRLKASTLGELLAKVQVNLIISPSYWDELIYHETFVCFLTRRYNI